MVYKSGEALQKDRNGTIKPVNSAHRKWAEHGEVGCTCPSQSYVSTIRLNGTHVYTNAGRCYLKGRHWRAGDWAVYEALHLRQVMRSAKHD